MNTSLSSEDRLAEVGRTAIALEAARVARAKARSNLSKQRRQWLEENDVYWDADEFRGREGDKEMRDAHAAREVAQVAFRRATSALRRATKRLAGDQQ